MTNKDMIRDVEAKKLAEEIQKKYDIEKIKELVKDNKITFKHNNNDYRIVLLSEEKKDALDILRRKKFGELLKDKDILFEKEIKKLYKERGIDIDEIDDKIRKAQNEIKAVNLKLGESLTKKSEPESIFKTYKNQIEDLMKEINALYIQKGNLLENSFEKTLEHYIIKVIAFLSLEIKQEDNYVQAFEKIEDFLKQDELLGKAIGYSMVLHYLI